MVLSTHLTAVSISSWIHRGAYRIGKIDWTELLIAMINSLSHKKGKAHHELVVIDIMRFIVQQEVRGNDAK